CVHELVGREQPAFDFSCAGKLLVYQDAASYGRALAPMSASEGSRSRQAWRSSARCSQPSEAW
ncbi:D-amino acid dehydrogenase small subunit, partial [Xylella fastidiosa subsp. multiplex]|nr:D-amino acid dehydrogenase small subunit [Xylella fastidiosa subsp. multiplex]